MFWKYGEIPWKYLWWSVVLVELRVRNVSIDTTTDILDGVFKTFHSMYTQLFNNSPDLAL